MPLYKKRKSKPANDDVEVPTSSPAEDVERRANAPGTSGGAGARGERRSYQPVIIRNPRRTTSRGRESPPVVPSKIGKSNSRIQALNDKDGDKSSSEDEILLADGGSQPQATASTLPSLSSGSSRSSPLTPLRPMVVAPPSPRKSSSEEMDVVDGEDKGGGPSTSVGRARGKRGAYQHPVASRRPKITTTNNNPTSNVKPSKAGVPDFEDSSEDEDLIDPQRKSSSRQILSSSSRSSKSSVSGRLSSRKRKSEGMDGGGDSNRSLVGTPETGQHSRGAPGSSVNGSESGVSEYSYDPNDPDWLNFTKCVKDSPANAHERLSEDLLQSSNCSALLGKLIYRSISSADLNGSDSRKLCANYGVTIIRSVLYLAAQNEHNKPELVVDLVNMLFTELRHFPTPVLYNITEYCLKYMKRDDRRGGSFPPRWIEIFGKLISVMITRGDIKHETDLMDGKDYRGYIITEICGPRLNWTTENTASLIAIIRQIPGIDDTELKVLILHIKSILKRVKAAALPPVVHQLLSLAGSRFPSELLTACAEYFENVDFSDLGSLEVRQKRNALGTVVFHFLEAARHCDILVKAVIKFVRASFFDFGKVMSPFMLSVVLGLTAFDHAKAGIIDPLRNSVMKSFHSLHLSEMSYWYQHRIGDASDVVTQCFKAVLETKSSELEFMFNGVRELGIGLLNADLYQSKYPNTLERCQKLGSYLITSLVKSCPDQLQSMMKQLLMVSSRSVVHTECLAKCLEMRTRQIIHPSIIGTTCEIIRHLPMMDSVSAAMLVKSLSSAFNLSYILLDQLLLNLRKTIWKSVEARRTSAKIMIILLSNSRVVGDIPYSQYSESQRFYNDSQSQQQSSSTAASQIPDNQPLCFEILAIATRCFTQQCEIREELYLGFHSVVRKNPGICELICAHLYKHTIQYFSENLDTTDGPNTDPPTILLGNAVDLPPCGNASSYTPAKIKEELGFLVQCLSFVVHKSHLAFNSIDGDPPASVNQLEGLLHHWIKAVLKMTPTTIEIAAADVVTGAGGGSRPLDAVRYVETIFTIQIMQVIEALIEFLNLENKPRNDKIVKKLFDKHTLIEPLLRKEKEKGSGKKGKGDKNKTKGKGTQKKAGKDKDATVDDVTISDDASETSENQQPGGVKFKKPDAPKRLFYFYILSLESALDMLRKLQKSNEDKGAVLSVPREEFEKFLLSAVKQKLTNFQRKEPMHERSLSTQKIVELFANIAGCIWNGLLMHNSEDEESDILTTNTDLMELRLELVTEIVTLLCSSHSSISCHLIKEFGDDHSDDVSYDEVFPKFFNSWKTVIGWMPTGNDEDKTIHQHLFNILHAFAKPLPPDPDADGQSRAAEVLNWTWNYMSTTSGKTGTAEYQLADTVVSCWLTYYMKGKDFLEQPGKRQQDILTLAMGVKQAMGIGDDVDTQYIDDSVKVKMWIINEDTAPTILCAIMYHVEMILDHITAVLAKLKCNPSDNEETQNKIGLLRGCCFTKIDEIVTVCSQLAASRFPACLCCATMLKIVPQIFSVMTGFGEYFFDLMKAKRPFSLKGFAKPVAKIGKQFKPLVESMINHVERVQREYADEACQRAVVNNKSKGVAKVPQAVKNQLLKEKKLIPNFVYVIEKYDQQIIALSKKSDKHKLLVGMKLSTARDFKIDSKKFTDAMNTRARSVQEITSVPDEETLAEVANNTTATAGPSRPRAAPRERKARKRKTTERDEEGENE